MTELPRCEGRFELVQTLVKDLPLRRFGANCLFLAVLFPFVSPIPIPSDTQPIAFIIAATMLLGECCVRRTFSRSDFLMLAFPICALGYFNPLAHSMIPEQLGKYVSLLAGAFVFVAARRNFHYFSARVFQAAIAIYFIYTLLLLAYPTFFLGLQGYFVRGINANVNNDPFAYRGVPTLSTEPGLFGGLLVFDLFVLDYFRQVRAISQRRYACLAAVIILMSLLSKSGTGYLYLLAYGTYYVAARASRGTLVVAAATAAAVLAYVLQKAGDPTSEFGRGVHIIMELADLSIFESDTSTLGRLYDFLVGFLSLKSFPFGFGVNGIPDATAMLNAEYFFLHRYNGTGSIGLVSGLSYCLVAFGFLGLIYLAYVYLIASRAPIGNRLFSLLYLSFSYSPAFPPLWVLLAQPRIRDIDIDEFAEIARRKPRFRVAEGLG